MDSIIFDLISQEQKRQRDVLEMIPSENYVSKDVLKALGSVLTNKYSEGYSHKRYYQGNNIIDEIEDIAVERAKKLFGVPHANIQPYSGSPANSAVYFSLLHPGDKIMGMNLASGGHLTHGHPKITFSGKYFTSVQYSVKEDGWIDYEDLGKIALAEKPQIIVCGGTAYARTWDFKRIGSIADRSGSLLLADISHIAGLIIGGVHPSPVPYVHIIMTTTHKTLRGPRGAILMVTDKGLQRDPEMGQKIDKAVFPGLQGGPHDNTTAAIAISLHEAEGTAFKKYTGQIVKNAKVLSEELMNLGFILVTGGTDNHLLLLDLRNFGVNGKIAAEALEIAGIVTNYNAIPNDPMPPMYPSGVRLGTPAITTRGMKEKEMKQISIWISEVINEVKKYQFPMDKERRKVFLAQFRAEIVKNQKLLQIAKDVKKLCTKFPLP